MVSNHEGDTEEVESQRPPEIQEGRENEGETREAVWEEVKVRAGERKTLHWICGGAKLPSGAT